MAEAPQTQEEKHRIAILAIEGLVPAADQPYAVTGEQFDLLAGEIDQLPEPQELIEVAEQLLGVAYSLQTEHGCPTAASAIADLSSHASRRATQLKKGWSGELDRVVDVGTRYERFRDGHSRFEGEKSEVTGPTIKIEALNRLRRV